MLSKSEIVVNLIEDKTFYNFDWEKKTPELEIARKKQ